MSYNITGYTSTHPYHEGKVGYINKFDKSIKLPFLNVLQNQLQSIKPAHIDEPELDDSEIVVSDNIELSSAVVGLSEISSQA